MFCVVLTCDDETLSVRPKRDAGQRELQTVKTKRLCTATNIKIVDFKRD